MMIRSIEVNGPGIRRAGLALLMMVVSLTVAQAQDRDRAKAQEFAQQQEQLKKNAVMRELDSGIYYLDNGAYALADVKFRYVLANLKSVPSDLTYYFGRNSYHLGKYKQSIDWLNKYIQLKGTNGQFSQDAAAWLARSEEAFRQENANAGAKAGEVLSVDYDIDCGPTGKVVCPVCRGEHVVIKKTSFGHEYKTCVYCNEHGILTCEEYNLLLRGKLKPKS